MEAHGEQQMADSRHVFLDEVVLHFAELEDPRSSVNLQHPLVSVVVIALMAVLAGAGGPTAIARWAAFKEEFLLKELNLPNGIPRKDVFRRVLMTLEPGVFQACFVHALVLRANSFGGYAAWPATQPRTMPATAAGLSLASALAPSICFR